MERRDFLKVLGAAGLAGCRGAPERPGLAAGRERPNILWITCEDIGPALGCYGDGYAATPNLDRLAAEGIRWTRAFATGPVCSPARSCLITGLFATSLGTQHLRSRTRLPAAIRAFPAHLRAAGWYCSNNYKEDYNFAAEGAWDESGHFAHWRHRGPGQPFFSVFNIVTTHQSRIDGPDARFFAHYTAQLAREERHDPAAAPVPPFYPDTAVVRKTIARYYDLVTLMDREAGALLAELEATGLAGDTIVFFFSDHGFGLPRFKRSLHDTGLRVPLIVRFPPRYRHLAPADPGAAVDGLVSFVDFAPTVLHLAGLPIPPPMQGRSFLGPGAAERPRYAFGAASRVDEAYEMARTVRDGRYRYIRNFMPHLPGIQASAYPDAAEIMGELRRLAAAGRLAGPAAAAMAPAKPVEELYDTRADPYEIRNLAGDPAQRGTLERMRRALRAWMLRTRDLGLLPEAEMLIRSKGMAPYEMARRPDAFPAERILAAADLVGRGAEARPRLVALLRDPDAGVRYWAAVGLEALGPRAAPAAAALRGTLADPSPCVRFEAAYALCALDPCEEALAVLARGLEDPRPYVVLYAARALQRLGGKARPVAAKVRETLRRAPGGLYEMFIRWALEGALRRCGS